MKSDALFFEQIFAINLMEKTLWTERSILVNLPIWHWQIAKEQRILG